jgi:hypothetical protein
MILLLPALVWAGVVWEPPLVQGVETTVVVTGEDGSPVVGEPLVVSSRPGLPGGRDLSVGVTDNRGAVRFVPAEGGPVELRAGQISVRTKVAWTSPPTAIPLLLGLIFAGALGMGIFGMSSARKKS